MGRTTAAVERTLPNLTHGQGTGLVLLTGVVFSFGGLAFRSTEASSAWEYLTFRGLGMLAVTSVIFIVQNRHRLDVVRSRFQPIHIAIGLMLAAMNALFIVALEFTTVAFVLFLQPVAPIAAAYFSWAIMRERVSRLVISTTMVTIVGVGVMVSGTLADDLSAKGLIALLIPLFFGFYTTTVRSSAVIDPSVPVITAGVALVGAGLVITAFSGGIDVPLRDALIGLLAGSILLGLPVAVFNTAQRVVPSPETALLLMVEVLLAPLWVWIFVDEEPPVSTLLGGTIILGAVIWLTLHRAPRPGRSFSSRG
ncbi:MAG: DMT family transporter [Acidimicrobiales bacterium]